MLRKHRRLILHYYKSLRTLKKQVCIIHPSSGTLELWKVLTWPSEGIWLAPHRCSLLGLLFLLCRYCFEHARTVWFTGDFYDIIKHYLSLNQINNTRYHRQQNYKFPHAKTFVKWKNEVILVGPKSFRPKPTKTLSPQELIF